MGKHEQARANSSQEALFERVEDCHALLGVLTRGDALEALRGMEQEQAMRVLAALERATGVLLERMPSRAKRTVVVPPHAGEDRHVDVHEAARIVGMSVKWLYRHSRTLPFTRVTASGRLRFSAKAIQVWLQAHAQCDER